MTDKERLIEIINTKIHRKNGVPLEVVIADYLLDNDVLPVIRCKDCKYFLPPTKNDFAACRYDKCGGMLAPAPNDFCSYGVPK